MYWFRSAAARFLPALMILFFVLHSCKPDIKGNGAVNFFDLKKYYAAEAGRLSKQNPFIIKTVTHNGATETQKVHINNWAQELSLFSLSDINKPAWKESYSVEITDDFLIYKAKFPELKTREIIIKRLAGKVKWVLIFNRTKNLLYQTKEKLSYFPDSLYLIEKTQQVKLLGINRYAIKGIY